MSSLVPLVDQPILYVNGLVPTWVTGGQKFSISDGAIRTADNTNDIVITAQDGSGATTVDCTTNGLNGLDTGSLTTNSIYYLWAIGCSNNAQPAGFIVSLSGTAPLMPANNYDTMKVFGYWGTNSGSLFIKSYVIGDGNSRTFIFDTPIGVLTAGTASSAFTLVTLAPYVPPIQNLFVDLGGSYNPATAGDSVTVVPGDSISTSGKSISGDVASVLSKRQFGLVLARLVSGVPQILYKNSASAGSANITLCSYQFTVN